MGELWRQNFNPLGNELLSTLAAVAPVCVLFYFLAVRRVAAWKAVAYAFVAAVIVALAVFHMPLGMVTGAVAGGLCYGWFRIAWVLVASVFVYEVSVESGQFAIIKESIASLSSDRRIQAVLIAFAFGALLEGVGGAGAPVAITGAMMIGLGFPRLQTAAICLLANSAPVAFGGMGNPVRTLVAVTGLPEADFSAMIGRILPITTLLLPFWLVRLMCPASETFAVWPVLVACGVIFGGIQFFWSNYIGAALVDVAGGIGTLALLGLFVTKVWAPRPALAESSRPDGAVPRIRLRRVFWAWLPFLLTTAFVVLWGVPAVAAFLEMASWKHPVPGLHLLVVRTPPVVASPYAEPALFDVAWLSSPGSAIFLAGIVAGISGGLTLKRTLSVFAAAVHRLRVSLIAIMAMLGMGYVTRYCGMDATMGMAMARTGVLFPFFGTMIGWMGVALSGTDAGSNALFGSLQVITANKLGLSPILMGAANSAGGVMGKMLAAQSLVIACAVTGQSGKEGLLFGAVLKHSLALMALVGGIVMLYAYVFPGLIPNGHRY